MDRLRVEMDHPEWLGKEIPVATAADREWMEPLGCDWPRPDREEAWLKDTNALIESGSQFWDDGDIQARYNISKDRRRLIRRIFGVNTSETDDYFWDRSLTPSSVGYVKIKELTLQAVQAGAPVDTLRTVLSRIEDEAAAQTVDEFFEEVDEDAHELSKYPDLLYERERAERINTLGAQALWKFRKAFAGTVAPEAKEPTELPREEAEPPFEYKALAEPPEPTPLTKEQIAHREEQYGVITSLDPKDREWTSVYGLRWPDPQHEEAWLEHVNEQIGIGSISARDQPEQRQAIFAARRFVQSLFPRIKIAFDNEFGAATRPPVSSDLFLGNIKELSTVKDIASKWNRHMVSKVSPAKLREHKAVWTDMGLDIDKLLDDPNGLGVLSLGPLAARNRVRTVRALSRALGYTDEEALQFIERHPNIVSNRPDRLRIIARIVIATLDPEQRETEFKSGRIISLLWNSLASVMAAYLTADNNKMPLMRLNTRAASLGRKMPADVLLGMIQANADDPIVNRYLRAYPIEKKDHVLYAYRRHQERQLGINNRADDIDIDWTGWELIGSPDDTAYVAYRRAIKSPPLTDEEYVELDRRITCGSVAARRIHEEYINNPYSVAEITNDDVIANDGMRARRTLIARHLGMVVEYAEARTRAFDSQAEIVSTGNLALVKAGMCYQPGEDGTFLEVAQAKLSNAIGRPIRGQLHERTQR